MSQGTAQKGTQPVSATALPLPAGASTEATLAAIKAKTDNLDVALSTRTKPADTQAVSATALPLPANAAQETGGVLAAIITELLTKARLTDTQPVSVAGGATSANQATQITSLAAIAASLVLLTLAQGTDGTAATGPMVQALVCDTPPMLTPNTLHPLSLTNDGRLRVVTMPSDAMHDFWPDPFAQDLADVGYWDDLPAQFSDTD